MSRTEKEQLDVLLDEVNGTTVPDGVNVVVNEKVKKVLVTKEEKITETVLGNFKVGMGNLVH